MRDTTGKEIKVQSIDDVQDCPLPCSHPHNPLSTTGTGSHHTPPLAVSCSRVPVPSICRTHSSSRQPLHGTVCRLVLLKKGIPGEICHACAHVDDTPT